MALGFVGLRRSSSYRPSPLVQEGLGIVVVGLLAMAAGNIAEYWLFVDQPHGSINARNLSWVGLLFGFLGVALGATLAGIGILRGGRGPRWLGVSLAVFIPATVVAAAISVSLLFAPLGLMAVLVGTRGLQAGLPAPSA